MDYIEYKLRHSSTRSVHGNVIRILAENMNKRGKAQTSQDYRNNQKVPIQQASLTWVFYCVQYKNCTCLYN